MGEQQPPSPWRLEMERLCGQLRELRLTRPEPAGFRFWSAFPLPLTGRIFSTLALDPRWPEPINGCVPVPDNWKEDYRFLLAVADPSLIGPEDLGRLVPVSQTMVFMERRRDPPFAETYQAYQAAFYERRASRLAQGGKGSANVVKFGLSARAGWREKVEIVTDEHRVEAQVSRQLIEELAALVPDPETRKKLEQHLEFRASLAEQRQLDEGDLPTIGRLSTMSARELEGLKQRLKGADPSFKDPSFKDPSFKDPSP